MDVHRAPISPCPDTDDEDLELMQPSVGDADRAAQAPTEAEADFTPLAEAEGEREPGPREVDPFQYDSLEAQRAYESALRIAESENEAKAVQEFIRAAKIAEVAHEWYLAAISCRRVGDFLLTPEEPCDVERALRMYRRAISAYRECGLFVEARELAYRVKLLRLRGVGNMEFPLFHRIAFGISWATAGFGYRPLRVIVTAMVIIWIYAFLYWLADGVRWGGSHVRGNFWHALYLSGITFVTVGYGDFIPAAHVRLLAFTEGFIGAFLIGLFAAVLANRLSDG
jgi:hypothetical protein